MVMQTTHAPGPFSPGNPLLTPNGELDLLRLAQVDDRLGELPPEMHVAACGWREILVGKMLPRLLGQPEYIGGEYRKNPDFYLDWRRILESYENPDLRVQLFVAASSPSQTIGHGSPRKIRIFPATGAAQPAWAVRELGGLDPERGASCFALFLPDPDAIVKERLVNHKRWAHVFGAFAYLRFYREGDRFVITEIESDHWKHLREPAEKKLRYRVFPHFVENLLLAFEEYVREACTGRPAEVAIVSPESIIARWKAFNTRRHFLIADGDHFGGIHPDTAERLYRTIPGMIGYEPRGELTPFRETDVNGREVYSDIVSARVILPRAKERDPLRREYAELVESRRTDAAYEVARICWDRIPAGSELKAIPRYDLPERESQFHADYLYVPVRRLEPSQILDLPFDANEVFRRQRRRPRDQWIRSPDASQIAVLPQQTALSLLDLGMRLPHYEKPSRRGRPLRSYGVTLQSQGEEPIFLQIATSSDGVRVQTLTSYEGGYSFCVQNRSKSLEGKPNSPFPLEYDERYPIRTFDQTSENIRARAAGLLALHRLGQLARVDLRKEAPSLLSIARYRSKPPTDHPLSWGRIIEGPAAQPERYGELITSSDFDIRLLTVERSAQSIRSAEKLDGKAAADAIRAVYTVLGAVYRVDYESPGGWTGVEPAELSGGAFLSSLRGALGGHREYADQVTTHFSRRLLKVMGLVHGAGGALSDTTGGEGALGAGSIDLAGCIHHLSAAYLPWSMREAERLSPEAVHELQRTDWESWRIAVRQFEDFVRGNLEAIASGPLLPADSRVRGDRTFTMDPSLRDVYQRHYRRGSKVAGMLAEQ